MLPVPCKAGTCYDGGISVTVVVTFGTMYKKLTDKKQTMSYRASTNAYFSFQDQFYQTVTLYNMHKKGKPWFKI